jgi:hypothetical protein
MPSLQYTLTPSQLPWRGVAREILVAAAPQFRRRDPRISGNLKTRSEVTPSSYLVGVGPGQAVKQTLTTKASSCFALTANLILKTFDATACSFELTGKTAPPARIACLYRVRLRCQRCRWSRQAGRIGREESDRRERRL